MSQCFALLTSREGADKTVMERIAFVVLAAAGALSAQELSPRLGALLRSDGILAEIRGPADKPRMDAKPSTTRFLQLRQAAGIDAWAATTKDSLIYTYADFHFRLPLDSAPTGLALSPNGKLVAVATPTTVTVYSRSFGILNRRKRADVADIGAVLEIGVSDNARLYITTAEKTYVHAMDARLDEFPIRATVLSDASIAYDAAAARLVFLQYNAFSNKASVEAVATADDGLKTPTAISHLVDAKIVWISQPGPENNLARLNLATRQIHLFTIPADGILAPTSQAGVYTWSDKALLDTNGNEPRLIPIVD